MIVVVTHSNLPVVMNNYIKMNIGNIYNNSNYVIYNTDAELNNTNINYLNKYLNEWCAQYYYYINKISFDTIGFCHYHRIFFDKMYNKNILNTVGICPINKCVYEYKPNVDYKLLYDHENEFTDKTKNLSRYENNICLWKEFINYQKTFSKDILTKALSPDIKIFYNREMYIAKRQMFIKLQEFIIEYLTFVSKFYGYDNKNIFENIPSIINKYYSYQIRKLGYDIEMLISIFIYIQIHIFKKINISEFTGFTIY